MLESIYPWLFTTAKILLILILLVKSVAVIVLSFKAKQIIALLEEAEAKFVDIRVNVLSKKAIFTAMLSKVLPNFMPLALRELSYIVAPAVKEKFGIQEKPKSKFHAIEKALEIWHLFKLIRGK